MKTFQLNKAIICLNLLVYAKALANDIRSTVDPPEEETSTESYARTSTTLNESLNPNLTNEQNDLKAEKNTLYLAERLSQLEHIIDMFISKDKAFLDKEVRNIVEKVIDDKKPEIVNEVVKAKLNLIENNNNSNNKISYNVHNLKCSNNRIPRNCYDINNCNNNIYNIQAPQYSNESFPAVCDLRTEGGGWTVIQQRKDGSENFYRNWNDYVEGFGNISGEFFIGLRKLHALTSLEEQPQELYIILQDFEGERKYAKYGEFKVDSEETDYTLHVGQYSGNVGDCFSSHTGQKFTTKDRDNDKRENENCAAKFKGGWWYSECYRSNLNGLYLAGKTTTSAEGITWCLFRGYNYSLKFVQMMIRPKTD